MLKNNFKMSVLIHILFIYFNIYILIVFYIFIFYFRCRKKKKDNFLALTGYNNKEFSQTNRLNCQSVILINKQQSIKKKNQI